MTDGLDPDVIAFAHQMFDLARNGETARLAEYVDAGLPPNLTNDKGDTLLILAAYNAHPDTVRALLERSADPERVNDRGQTALGAAVFRRSGETVRILLDRGAGPDTGSPSAVELARFFELPDMLRLLGARD
ncbi:MAG: ankyrin repeat domain-containing protein [Actinomycetota bacterium]|nr:ankyrin repeat domain-containing protein [Actinomycetota bacterium]